ncbi:cytochrome b/b6 domain-containing protein [Ferrigenium kumadai]|uniref:cytochrome b/b6 domain-containing protein n=1 Tax=Ferrigenium kumadai TaxID=1682490 RepID=UPI001BB3681D|nr:cytochrome b/b6 domain-containing protein [Ferrigenium kumadai]
MQQIDRNRINEGRTVKVWDLFIRFFHWTLVLGCVTAFISGEVHASEIHVLTGYALCALLVARVYWGFKGSEFARFRSFIFSVGETLAYVRSMFGKHPCKHYFGHNPAGALMVFTLLGLLASLMVTGLVTLAAIDFEGPLVFLANVVSDETSYAFRHVHEFLSTVGLVLVAFHLMGVVGGSIQHNENLVKAMVTGKKELPANQNENGER